MMVEFVVDYNIEKAETSFIRHMQLLIILLLLKDAEGNSTDDIMMISMEWKYV